ncbi:MAG: DUF1648 domain-containing protein [Cyclobacteriaceae bacterium]
MNPKISLSMSFLDWALEILGALFIIGTWYLLLTNFWVLPEQIPVHYDFWGNPNIYSNKKLIWLTPILMTAVYIGINFLNKIPHLLNYPISVTEANALKLYTINLRTLRVIRVLIAGQLLYGKTGLIGISIGELSKLSTLQMPIFLGGLALTITISYLLMYQQRNIGKTVNSEVNR